MGVDARDLRRDVRAQAQQAARKRVDHLERLQIEIVAGAGQQRIEVFDQRRLHQAVTVLRENGRATRGAARSIASASAGRMSSMYSGRSHLRIEHRQDAKRRQQIEMSPTKRSCPSDSSVIDERCRARACGASKGSRPFDAPAPARTPPETRPALLSRSTTACCAKARAASAGRRTPPGCFRYWKNSELGSSTSTSLLFLKVALYASRLR